MTAVTHIGGYGTLPERQRAEHLLHLRTMADQCANAARNLPHNPSREAATRNEESLRWALAQLEAKPKTKPRVVVEPPPDDLWDQVNA